MCFVFALCLVTHSWFIYFCQQDRFPPWVKTNLAKQINHSKCRQFRSFSGLYLENMCTNCRWTAVATCGNSGKCQRAELSWAWGKCWKQRQLHYVVGGTSSVTSTRHLVLNCLNYSQWNLRESAANLSQMRLWLNCCRAVFVYPVKCTLQWVCHLHSSCPLSNCKSKLASSLFLLT